jgi:hypothetical protein
LLTNVIIHHIHGPKQKIFYDSFFGNLTFHFYEIFKKKEEKAI